MIFVDTYCPTGSCSNQGDCALSSQGYVCDCYYGYNGKDCQYTGIFFFSIPFFSIKINQINKNSTLT